MLGTKTGKQKEPSPARYYLAALLAPAAVAGLIQLTWPLFKETPEAIFLLAIAFCSWYGGLRAGLISTIVSLLLADYLFLPPYFSLLHYSRDDFTRAIVLLEDGCEEFSNIHGIDQIRFEKKRIKETFGDVVATIRREFPEGAA